MQKLVIHTQYRENYGFPEWDGKGECPQHWKFKGGNTYFIPNFKDFNNVNEVIGKLISVGLTYKNEASEEYILDWDIVPHSEKICESWDTPVQISIDGDKITALKITDNRPDEDGYTGWMRSEILEKTESWTMTEKDDRKDYKASYLMQDGDIVDMDAGLREWFDNNKECA